MLPRVSTRGAQFTGEARDVMNAQSRTLGTLGEGSLDESKSSRSSSSNAVSAPLSEGARRVGGEVCTPHTLEHPNEIITDPSARPDCHHRSSLVLVRLVRRPSMNHM